MNYCELLVIGYWNDFREICEVMDDGRGGCERFEKLYVCVLLYVYNSFEISLKGNRKGKCILLTRNSEICRECYCKLGMNRVLNTRDIFVEENNIVNRESSYYFYINREKQNGLSSSRIKRLPYRLREQAKSIQHVGSHLFDNLSKNN